MDIKRLSHAHEDRTSPQISLEIALGNEDAVMTLPISTVHCRISSELVNASSSVPVSAPSAINAPCARCVGLPRFRIVAIQGAYRRSLRAQGQTCGPRARYSIDACGPGRVL